MAELTIDQKKALAKARARLRANGGGENVIATREGGGRLVRMDDGSVSFVSPEFSTNDPETVQRLMQGEGTQEVVQSGFDRQVISQNPVAARGNEFVRGVPFVGSFADEAVGLVSPDARDAMRLTTDAMRRERPGETTALNLAGGIAGSAPLAVAAAPIIAAAAPASRLNQFVAGLLGGSVGGGVEGVIYGSGEGTTTSERAESARGQGQIGAALGGALGAVAPFAADAFEGALKFLKRSDTAQIASRFGISRAAARVVKQHVDSGDIVAARQALSQAGDEGMLGEATKGASSLLDALAARGGAAEQIVNDAIETRVARGNRVFRQASDDALGAPPQGLLSAADEISARTAPRRAAAYDAAFSTPIDYASSQGRAVEEVLGRVPPGTLRAAINDANEEMLSLGQRNMQIMAEIADDGSVTFREMPNVMQLDQIKRSLDRLAKRDEFGRLAPEGVRPARLAGELRDATVAATGGADGTYGRALAIGGDKIAEDNALRLGSRLMRPQTTRDEVIRAMRGASEDAKNSLRVGFRDSINEMMDNVRTVASDRNVDAREVKRMVDQLSSKAMRDKVRIVLGPREADRFFATVDELTSGLNLRAAVSENSRTARRQAVNQTLDEASAPNALQRAAAGEPVEATKRVVQLLTGETPDAQAFRQEGVAEEIARFLTQTRGRSAETALTYINRALSGQRLTNAQANYVANVLATTGYLSGGRAGQQALLPPR